MKYTERMAKISCVSHRNSQRYSTPFLRPVASTLGVCSISKMTKNKGKGRDGDGEQLSCSQKPHSSKVRCLSNIPYEHLELVNGVSPFLSLLKIKHIEKYLRLNNLKFKIFVLRKMSLKFRSLLKIIKKTYKVRVGEIGI